MKTNINNLNGATLVEFALILMLFLTLVFGIIEFSVLLFNKHVVTNACREGARTGIVMRTNTPAPRDVGEENDLIIAKVVQFAKNNLISFGGSTFDAGSVKVLPENRDLAGTTFGRDLIVEATFDYNFLFLSLFLDPIELQSTAIMRME